MPSSRRCRSGGARVTATSRPARCRSATATADRTTACRSTRRSAAWSRPSRRVPRSDVGPINQQGTGGSDGPEALERIWTPHRMAYIRSSIAGDGCPFCIIPGLPDADSLVVARGEHTYVVLNLHPYNPGHLMVLPYRHVAGLEELTAEESSELMALTQRAITVIRSISTPHAFNVGLNLGGAAEIGR